MKMMKMTTAILLSCQAILASPTPDRFMDTLPEHLRLIELSLLGSHDAGTYGLNPCMGVSPDEYGNFIYTIGNIPLIGLIVDATIVKAWAQSQLSDISGQLNQGSRYFDLRFVLCSDGSYRVCHGLYGPLLDDVLSQINGFLDNHPQEIVLLDLSFIDQSGNNLGTDQQTQVIGVIEKSLGNKIAPASYGANVTLGQMWQNHNQSILFWRDSAVAASFPELLWDRNTFLSSTWYNQTDWSALEQNLTRGIADRPLGVFYVNQAVLTPNATMIINNLFSNLLNIGAAADAEAMGWWQEMASAKIAGSILMLDNVDSTYNEAFQICLKYNQSL